MPDLHRSHRRALGSNDSFRRQLNTGLDAWMATFDSVLTRDSNGHHGVSVGDADGDGLDDIYVAQPSGLPNRLYRARGDGTFEDATERAGLACSTTRRSRSSPTSITTATRISCSPPGRSRSSSSTTKAGFRRRRRLQFRQPLQGVLTSIAMADYDRDGFLDLTSASIRIFRRRRGQGRNTGAVLRCPQRATGCSSATTVAAASSMSRRRRASTPVTTATTSRPRGPTTTMTAGPTCSWPTISAEKPYRNRGLRDGVTFEDVAADAGVLDHGAGMSAAFLDYDNDGLLDIYTGNMWSDAGLRVTSAPSFMPDAPADVRALYRRHVRGNSLLRNRGDGHFEDKTLAAPRGDGPVGVVIRCARLRQRWVGGPLRRQRHAHAGTACRIECAERRTPNAGLDDLEGSSGRSARHRHRVKNARMMTPGARSISS